MIPVKVTGMNQVNQVTREAIQKVDSKESDVMNRSGGDFFSSK